MRFDHMNPGKVSTYEQLSTVLIDAEASELTAAKAASLLHDGWYVSGLVLTNEEGRTCIVDKSAVRWLGKDEFWWLMHDSESPLNHAEKDGK